MTDDVFVRHCAPTLAGIKTGSLFSCAFPGDAAMRECVRRWNSLLREKRLRVLPLRGQNGRWLLYVYRPARLSQDLLRPEVRRLLRECGYETFAAEACLCDLGKRLRENGAFPHEIGLFLGYPPEDVRGFIENGPRKAKYTGAWKVYEDVSAAKMQFENFQNCTVSYCELLNQGKTIDRLTVAD